MMTPFPKAITQRLLRAAIAIFPLLALLAAGCTADDPADMPETPVGLTGINIAVAQPLSRSVASEETRPAANSRERIHEWWMVFVKNGRVVYVTDEQTVANDEGVEHDNLANEIPLLPGTYTIYAFANFPKAWVKSGVVGNPTFDVGDADPFASNPNLKDHQRPTDPAMNLTMTGKLENVGIPVAKDKSVTVPVTRLFGKVSASLRNASNKSVKLKQLTIEPVSNHGQAPLLPGNPIAAPNDEAPLDLVSGSEVITIASGATSESYFSYIRETAPADGAPFRITAAFDRILTAADGTDRITAETLTATIPTADVASIARNEWLNIPLVVNNYIFRALVRFYPPIGGFPAYTVDEEADGRITTTFRTPGAFTILPSLYLDTAPDTPLSTASYTLDKIEVVGVDGNAVPEGFFTKSPTQEGTTGEITGEIGSVEGTAELRLTFTVGYGDIDPDTNKPAYEHTYTRSVIIVRDATTTPDITMHFNSRLQGATANDRDGARATWTSATTSENPVQIRFSAVSGQNNIQQFSNKRDPLTGISTKCFAFGNDAYTLATIDENWYVKKLTMRMRALYVSNQSFDFAAWTPSSFKAMYAEFIPQDILNVTATQGSHVLSLTPNDVKFAYGLVNFTQAGRQTITFTYSSGRMRLNILGVDIIDANGNVVSHDYHYGFAGNPSSNNSYVIDVPATGLYTVRYFITPIGNNFQNAPINSSGTISYTSAPQAVNQSDPKYIPVIFGGKHYFARNDDNDNLVVSVNGTPDAPIRLEVNGTWIQVWEFDVVVAKKQ